MLSEVLTHARNGTLGARLRLGRDGWHSLTPTLGDVAGTPSARRINSLHQGMPACSTYLEIGVQRGRTLQDVKVPFRWGVDPAPLFRTDDLPAGVRFSTVTSDEFFAGLPAQHQFDLAFLDGLHEWSQTYRDLLNSLNHAPAHCILLIDDVMPSDRYSALPDLALAQQRKIQAGIGDGRWHGDVFKVLLAVHQHHPELNFVVVGSNAPDDNAQALLWRRDRQAHKYTLDHVPELVDEYAAHTYDDVFVGGAVPEFFGWMDEGEGLARALAGG